jgi:hypothetical protein
MNQIFKDLSELTSTILLALSIASCAGPGAARVEKSEASSPPGYSMTRGGDAHDFDYFAGGWTTRQRRLKTRGVGGAVLGKWRSRADADCVREKYKDSETISQLIPLLVRPRDRWVTYEDGEPSEIEQTSKGKKQ